MNLRVLSSYRHKMADLSVLVTLAGIVIWYCWDAFTASSHILNLMLILPVTIIVLLLCLVEFVSQLYVERLPSEQSEPIVTIIPVVALFTSYVLTLPWLGFDVGTFLFVGLFLWSHGERRIQWTIGYAICFAALMAFFFSTMLPYPMPMLILYTDY